jgi:predicted nucleic acid-binding protein
VLVPDASATALLFGSPSRDPRVLEARRVMHADPDWAVPEHWRIELMSVLRGLVRGQRMTEARAARAVTWLGQVTVLTLPTVPQLDRIWELRSNLSAYDAGYVAVAESHDLTLVTADMRIARAGVARCPIRVIA